MNAVIISLVATKNKQKMIIFLVISLAKMASWILPKSPTTYFAPKLSRSIDKPQTNLFPFRKSIYSNSTGNIV